MGLPEPPTAVWRLCCRRGHLSPGFWAGGPVGVPGGFLGGVPYGGILAHTDQLMSKLSPLMESRGTGSCTVASRKAKLRPSEPQAQRPSFPGQCSGTPQEEEASLPKGEPQSFLVPHVQLSPGCWWAGDTLSCLSFPHRVQVVPICLSCAEPSWVNAPRKPKTGGHPPLLDSHR